MAPVINPKVAAACKLIEGGMEVAAAMIDAELDPNVRAQRRNVNKHVQKRRASRSGPAKPCCSSHG